MGGHRQAGSRITGRLVGDLHVVLGLIHHRELKQSAHVTQNFRKRGPRFWTLGVSLWTLLSGDQGELRSCFAEISLHGDWGLKQAWAQLWDPCPPYSHSSTRRLVVCVLKVVCMILMTKGSWLLKKQNVLKNTSHQHLGKDEGFGGPRTMC